jgi:hypothetical protein
MALIGRFRPLFSVLPVALNLFNWFWYSALFFGSLEGFDGRNGHTVFGAPVLRQFFEYSPRSSELA